MELQNFVDNVVPMSCVLSVEKTPEGNCGKIRIVCGNRAYADSFKPDHLIGSQLISSEFVPNSEYERYFPKNISFEENCFRAAIQHEPVYTYVQSDQFDALFNIFVIPLCSDQNDVGYCLYSMTVSKDNAAGVMSSLSHETAADVLNTCIKLRGASDFESTVNDVVADICRICDARHVCLLMVDYTKRSCYMLAQAYADSARKVSMNHWQDEEHFLLVETWADIIGDDSCLIVRNEDDMGPVKEKNPAWYESLHRASVDSIVLFPLKAGGSLIGYIWATNFDIMHTVRIKETLELTTFFLASEIYDYQSMNRLQRMSTIDELTGVMNRNAMNNRVNTLNAGKVDESGSIGVVFADLNGLKKVNDLEGHQAGDLLLKNASMALQNVFIGDEIYRAGGDEFVIFLPGADRECIDKKAETLRSISASYGNVSFAIGTCVQSDQRKILDALKEADKAMYEDKEQFYRDHPERKRRTAGENNES
ncbi:MAG: GGDEF domain-containing protein [Lachnospiraceae bacterium]|nr:GGDEF domain-containing protein [Lachnospiraceae bacterium]